MVSRISFQLPVASYFGPLRYKGRKEIMVQVLINLSTDYADFRRLFLFFICENLRNLWIKKQA